MSPQINQIRNPGFEVDISDADWVFSDGEYSYGGCGSVGYGEVSYVPSISEGTRSIKLRAIKAACVEGGGGVWVNLGQENIDLTGATTIKFAIQKELSGPRSIFTILINDIEVYNEDSSIIGSYPLTERSISLVGYNFGTNSTLQFNLLQYVGSFVGEDSYFILDNVITEYLQIGDLDISSNPSGATIYIDGERQIGITTPASITGLSSGPHTFTLELEGYENTTGTFDIITGQITILSVIFKGCIYFQTNPSGANIFIDGINTEKVTPDIVCDISGNHDYLLVLNGYETVADCTDLTGDQGTTISTDLIPATIPTEPKSYNISASDELQYKFIDYPWYYWSDTEPHIISSRKFLDYYTGSIKVEWETLNAFADSDSWVAKNGEPVTDIVTTYWDFVYHTRTIDNISLAPGDELQLIAQGHGLPQGGQYYGAGKFQLKYSCIPPCISRICPSATGDLNISSTPLGATVFIDGVEQIGAVTTVTIAGLDPGIHNIKLMLVGPEWDYEWIGTADIVSGQLATLSVDMYATSGALNILSTPPGAAVFIGGRDTELTTPATMTHLTPGIRTYKLVLEGYVEKTGTFNIIAGQTNTIDVGNLTPIAIRAGLDSLSSLILFGLFIGFILYKEEEEEKEKEKSKKD